MSNYCMNKTGVAIKSRRVTDINLSRKKSHLYNLIHEAHEVELSAIRNGKTRRVPGLFIEKKIKDGMKGLVSDPKNQIKNYEKLRKQLVHDHLKVRIIPTMRIGMFPGSKRLSVITTKLDVVPFEELKTVSPDKLELYFNDIKHTIHVLDQLGWSVNMNSFSAVMDAKRGVVPVLTDFHYVVPKLSDEERLMKKAARDTHADKNK